ncbi:MAG: hypothetical protein HMLKMBBP_02286 [Planctomycetes bacterium]|nr:hypothetical protein [Planctomycetota bacterium]
MTRFRDGWVFSRRADLVVFGGPVAAAAAITWGHERWGSGDALPPWLFLLLVVACDVGHVWATLFRTYLDPAERGRRGGMLTAVPVLCFVAGALLWQADGGRLFWRVLAYLAAFHFVRQQVGWMAYAARRAGEESALDRRLDRAAIYAATVAPLVWWHANLPRRFRWFVDGDFAAGLPPWCGDAAMWAHGAVLAAWAIRQAHLAAARRGANRAKWLVLGSTWLTWVGGIVLLDSDVAFTASNVLAHGVPYMWLVHRWGAERWARSEDDLPRSSAIVRSLPALVGFVALVAWIEEAAWDAAVWHDHRSLFPIAALDTPGWAMGIVVPLLAVPQAVHYVLDAWIWRTRGTENPGLRDALGMRSDAA